MHPDFKDLLSEFNAQKVEYLVVGAHALAAYGHVRATKDIDVWVRPHDDNARRILKALASFGAPISEVTAKDFSNPDFILQIGVDPVRIDVITSITAVTFDEAWPRRVEATFDGESVSVLSKDDLLRNKSATGRPQDLADVDWLKRHT